MQEILLGVLQRTILGPLLSKIFLSDLFLTAKSLDIASYVDDTTLYFSETNLGLILKKVELTTNDILQCFSNNTMNANPEKCLLLLTTQEKQDITVMGNEIKNNSRENSWALKMTVNSDHVNKICDKANHVCRNV